MADRSAPALAPVSALPLAYFLFAHAAMIAACAVLAVRPGLPGAFFFHPRMVAVVHLVTLGWLTGSVLGAFYIVAPLVLGMPLPVDWRDWTGYGAFTVGVLGMVSHFWMGEYDGMVWAAILALAAVGWVAWRAMRSIGRAKTPWPVKLHVVLAFVNVLAAGGIGVAIGLNRSHGFVALSPLDAAYAHAHLAAVGWVAMMVVGIGYRLIPMMVPAAMPAGTRLAISAILIEAGVLVVAHALVSRSPALVAGAILIGAGLASFARQIRAALAHRLPRPPALPQHDWSVWQAHAALVWLLVAFALGTVLSVRDAGPSRTALAWWYGVAGLVGFLAQMVAGIQGRLVPMYAWYRARARLGELPARGAHTLPSTRFARVIFLAWACGVPLSAFGLSTQQLLAIRLASLALLAGTAAGAAYLVRMMRLAQKPAAEPRPGA
jgi:hypothetical protein